MYTNKDLNEMNDKGRYTAYQRIANEATLDEIFELEKGHRVKIVDLMREDYDRRILLKLTKKGLSLANSDGVVILEGANRKIIRFGGGVQPFPVRQAIYLWHRYGKNAIQPEFFGLVEQQGVAENQEIVPIGVRQKTLANMDVEKARQRENEEKDQEIARLRKQLEEQGSVQQKQEVTEPPQNEFIPKKKGKK